MASAAIGEARITINLDNMSEMRRDLGLDDNNQPIKMTVEDKIAQVRAKFTENDIIKTIFPGRLHRHPQFKTIEKTLNSILVKIKDVRTMDSLVSVATTFEEAVRKISLSLERNLMFEEDRANLPFRSENN